MPSRNSDIPMKTTKTPKQQLKQTHLRLFVINHKTHAKAEWAEKSKEKQAQRERERGGRGRNQRTTGSNCSHQ